MISIAIAFNESFSVVSPAFSVGTGAGLLGVPTGIELSEPMFEREVFVGLFWEFSVEVLKRVH